MATTAGGCRDLRRYMDDQKTQEIFGYLISGKRGYMPIQERRVEVIRCKGCGRQMNEEEKFCPECGTKLEKPAPAPATENADAPASN